MLEDDIHKALERQPEASLDQLEADVWRAVDARVRTSRAVTVVASWQVVVVTLALISSVVSGTFAAHSSAAGATRLNAFSPELALAPSTLLLGNEL